MILGEKKVRNLVMIAVFAGIAGFCIYGAYVNPLINPAPAKMAAPDSAEGHRDTAAIDTKSIHAIGEAVRVAMTDKDQVVTGAVNSVTVSKKPGIFKNMDLELTPKQTVNQDGMLTGNYSYITVSIRMKNETDQAVDGLLDFPIDVLDQNGAVSDGFELKAYDKTANANAKDSFHFSLSAREETDYRLIYVGKDEEIKNGQLLMQMSCNCNPGDPYVKLYPLTQDE